jgi:hypothetical protein
MVLEKISSTSHMEKKYYTGVKDEGTACVK